MELVEQIKIFRPWNEQEERDRTELLRRLESGEELYTRDNALGPPDGLGLGSEPGPAAGADGLAQSL